MVAKAKMLLDGLPLWLAETNCWIVAPDGPGGECVLIDVPPDPTAIINALHKYELKLDAIILTHGHVDHVGGLPGVEDHLTNEHHHAHSHDGLPVHIHRDDHYRIEDPVSNSTLFGSMLEQSGITYRPPELIVDINHGTVVKGAGMEFTAVHTPGHTEGSTCFTLKLDDAPDYLFSGDHLFNNGIGRTDLPGGDYDKLMESMAERVLPLNDDVFVLPGHGPTTTIGQEKRQNEYIQHLLK